MKYKTIKINVNDLPATYYVQTGDYTIKIDIGNTTNSDMEFATSSEGRFLNFIT